MPGEDDRLLADRQHIRDVVVRYFAGLDRKDPDLFDQVFVADAVMTVLDGARSITGREDIVRSLMTVKAYAHTSHFPASQIIEVDGDRAQADSFAIAYIVLGAPEERVLVRGLQYLDDLVRTSEGWRIARRRHIPTWQCELDSLPAALPGQT